MKKIIWIGVIVVVCVILIVAGVNSLLRPANKNKDTGVYTNTAYGLSFSYPPTYTAQDRDIGTGLNTHHLVTLITKADKELILQNKMPSPGPTSITFDIYPANGEISLEEWLSNPTTSHFDIANGFATTSVGAAKTFAVAYSWNGTFRTNSIVFEHKNYITMVSMTYTSPQDQIWKDFSAIIKSIKLF